MKTQTLKISPPWIVWQKQAKALFENDPDIRIDAAPAAADPEITLYVAKPAKAVALARMLPECKEFGNVKCRLTVVPPNGAFAMPKAPDNPAELAAVAFTGNAAVETVRPVSKGLFANLAYVAFKREVVQFSADNIADINGNWSGLYEDIAREVCERAEGIFFCTAGAGELTAGLGVWP